MKKLLFVFAAAIASTISANAQSFDSTGATTMSVTIAPEASISVGTSTTSLSSSGTLFSNYTGLTNFTYKVRTSGTGGSGSITLKVTSDFNEGGPSVASPLTAGDVLTYICTAASSGTACSGSQTSATSSSTPVVSFGADAHSSISGDSGSASWTLTNDPKYKTGAYTATVTFTISAA